MRVEEQWDLIRKGYVEEGISLMQQTFEATPNPSTLVNLGLGYLWTERYEDVCRLFVAWMDRYRTSMEIYFALIGVAQWCLNDPIAATESWRSGLEAQHLDMAGGMESPLLLWLSAVLRQDKAAQAKALHVLEAKVKNSKAKHWPGPLGRFVLGDIDEKSLSELSKGRNGEETSLRRSWQISFYKIIWSVRTSDVSRDKFLRLLRVELRNLNVDFSESDEFLQVIRNPEFYLARHERLGLV